MDRMVRCTGTRSRCTGSDMSRPLNWDIEHTLATHGWAAEDVRTRPHPPSQRVLLRLWTSEVMPEPCSQPAAGESTQQS